MGPERRRSAASALSDVPEAGEELRHPGAAHQGGPVRLQEANADVEEVVHVLALWAAEEAVPDAPGRLVRQRGDVHAQKPLGAAQGEVLQPVLPQVALQSGRPRRQQSLEPHHVVPQAFQRLVEPAVQRAAHRGQDPEGPLLVAHNEEDEGRQEILPLDVPLGPHQRLAAQHPPQLLHVRRVQPGELLHLGERPQQVQLHLLPLAALLAPFAQRPLHQLAVRRERPGGFIPRPAALPPHRGPVPGRHGGASRPRGGPARVRPKSQRPATGPEAPRRAGWR
mmetsp:Transcript_543/g.1448  ORF Transcript_543/g.1448 Transcript_543/m.1448 type:complete len:280 (+) Transcript_543:730-1569(+)